MTRSRPRATPPTPQQLQDAAPLRNLLLARAPDAWFTADEAALYLGCARRTLRNHLSARRIAADGRSGVSPLFHKKTLDDFLTARAHDRQPPPEAA